MSQRWSRADGIVDVEALGRRRVLVAGVGSGGSTVALELAKAGVGGFTLVDPDRVEETNLIRHECDDRYLGWNKADAVADLVRHRNPEAKVDVIGRDLFDLGARLETEVGRADLVAVCTDSEPPRHLVNRICVAESIPAVYAGVYEGGHGGEILRCMGGGADACYACVTSVLKESVPLPAGEERDYGVVGGDGTFHGSPGLGLDVRMIALIHAKVCLLTLADDPGLDGNVVLFGNSAMEGLFPRPLASAILRVAVQDACLVCGPLRRGELARV